MASIPDLHITIDTSGFKDSLNALSTAAGSANAALKNLANEMAKMHPEIKTYELSPGTKVPVGELWVRLIPNVDIPDKLWLVKVLREESDCPVPVAHDGIDAFKKGAFLRFKVHGQAFPTTFVHDAFQPFLSGTQVPPGSEVHEVVFATNMYAAAQIAAEADAEGAPVCLHNNDGTMQKKWLDSATGLSGTFNQDYKTGKYSPQVNYTNVHWWASVPKDDDRAKIKAHRVEAVADIRKAFGLELKPALRVLAALIAGRVIRVDKVVPGSVLWGKLSPVKGAVPWEKLHKPLLKLASLYEKPPTQEPLTAKKPEEIAREALDNLQLPPLTEHSRAQVMTIHQLKEVAELAYGSGLYQTARAIAAAMLTIPAEKTKAESAWEEGSDEL